MATKAKTQRVDESTWEIKDRTYILKGNKSPITYTLASRHHNRNPLMV